jgi:hypothetical protein
MKGPDKPPPRKDEPPPWEGVRQIIEEYAESLREIIKTLRRRLH